MNKLLNIILSILMIMSTTTVLYAYEESEDDTQAYNTYLDRPYHYGDRDSIEEWNRRHTGNYIQKVNDDFYVIPNTPHSIQIRQISDTIRELDVQ